MFEREFDNEAYLEMPLDSVRIGDDLNLKLLDDIEKVDVYVYLKDGKIQLNVAFGGGDPVGTPQIEPYSTLFDVESILGYADKKKTHLTTAELWTLTGADHDDIIETLNDHIRLEVTRTLLEQFKESAIYLRGWCNGESQLSFILVLARNGAEFGTLHYVIPREVALTAFEERQKQAA